MSNNIITRKDGEWLVISLVPDICKTPIGSSIIPIPYPTVAKLGDAVKEIPHVKANGAPLVTIAGHIPTTQGAEVGVKKGIKSGTVGGAASYKKDSHSSNVRAGKQPILRHGDMFWMNGKAPDNAPATKSVSHVEQRKLRYQERKSLITKTADNGDPVIRAANQRLSLNNDNILRAEAADYVYKVDEYNRGT